MGFFRDLFKDPFDAWLASASDAELAEEYERRRLEWLRAGGDKTPEMRKLDLELSRRSAERWKHDPFRNPDPNFRWTDAARWDRDRPPFP